MVEDEKVGVELSTQVSKVDSGLNGVEIQLENGIQRVSIYPELGGRIGSWLDKRQHRTIVETPSTWFQPLKINGASFTKIEPNFSASEEGEDDSQFWQYQLELERGIGVHTLAKLRDGGVGLELDWRVNIRESLRRELRLSLFADSGAFKQQNDREFFMFDESLWTGFWVSMKRIGIQMTDSELGVRLVTPSLVNQGRLSFDFGGLFVPFFGIGYPKWGSEFGILGEDDRGYSFLAHRQALNAKVIADIGKGQPIEATISFYPEIPVTFGADVFGSNLQKLVVLDEKRIELFRYERDSSVFERHLVNSNQLQEFPKIEWNSLSDFEIEQFEISPLYRGLASQERSRRAFVGKKYESAVVSTEQTLLFNGDEPVSWWEQALAVRLAGRLDEDDPALENLHFLAPLDPLLRAESFLRTAIAGHPDPSPLVGTIAPFPAMYLEPALRLLERGVDEDAARWIEEVLRVREGYWLRMLMAHLNKKFGLEVEANFHLSQARKIPPEIPLIEAGDFLRSLNLQF